MKARSCTVADTSTDAQGVTHVLRAVTSTGDVLSALTGHAIGRLYSGCSHLRCLRWNESGPHFVFECTVMIEIYVLWLKWLPLVRCGSNITWPERVNGHGFVYPDCEVDSLKLAFISLCTVTMFKHEVT